MIANHQECRFRRIIRNGYRKLEEPVRQPFANLRVDPLRVTDGKNLRRVREVGGYPYVVLPKAIVRKWKLARQMRRDAVCRDRHIAVAE